jgi:iron complex transport system permease protein
MMQARVRWMMWSVVVGALALTALGICVGSVGFENLLQPLLNPTLDPERTAMAKQIVWEIRLPRTLGAWAAGALLGLAGGIAQGLFRNPLADPYLLGSASGASLGVALALAAMGGGAGMLGGSGSVGNIMNGGLAVSVFSSSLLVRLGLTGAAFVGAVLAVLLTLALSRGVGHTLRLLLAGVVVGVVLGAMTHLVLLLSPDSLQAMQAFMLGSTAFVGWVSVGMMAVVWAVCIAAAWLLARVLDGLSLGDATAQSLGLAVAPMRAALVAVLALATGTAVAQTGLIAFVGLAAPHLVRSVVKTTHGQSILLASLVGGVLLMAADTLARWLIAPQELPVGVLTAVLGGGYLLWLMHRGPAKIGSAL